MEKPTIAGRPIEWIVLARHRFNPDNIECRYFARRHVLPNDLQKMYDDFLASWLRDRRSGKIGLSYNSDLYKLESFDARFRKVEKGEEIPALLLNFRPTNYFTTLVTDRNTGNSFRDRYFNNVDVTVQPVPQFASILQRFSPDLILPAGPLRSDPLGLLPGGPLHYPLRLGDQDSRKPL